MIDQGEAFMIHHLKRHGLSIQAISHRTGLDRKTVRKYLQNGLDPPSYGPRKRKPSILGRLVTLISLIRVMPCPGTRIHNVHFMNFDKSQEWLNRAGL